MSKKGKSSTSGRPAIVAVSPGPVVEDPQCVRVAIDIQLNDVIDLKLTNAGGVLLILTLMNIITTPTIGSLVVV